MRVAWTVLSVAALCLGFIQAPFLHIHVEEHDHDHDHAATSLTHVHTHSFHEASGTAIGAHTPDEDAIDVGWHIAAPQIFHFIPDLSVTEAVAIAPLELTPDIVLTPQPRGHDPPDIVPKQARSPPA